MTEGAAVDCSGEFPGLEALGLERLFDVGLRLRVPHERVPALAEKLSQATADFPCSGARLVGADLDRTVHRLTIAVSLGTVEDVAGETERAKTGVALVARLVEDLTEFLPGLCEIPAADSHEAVIASALVEGVESGSASPAASAATSIRELVAVAG